MTKDLQKRRTWRFALFVLLLSVAGMNKSYAYDFSAVCSTGQTLYYNITDASNHYVELTCPGEPGGDSWPNTFTKPTGNITLPSNVTYGGTTYTVTAIGGWCFNDCNGLNGSLVIPNTVTTIGGFAFSGCSGFNGNLTIGNSVATIQYNAFNNCTNFTGSLIVPNSVTSIEVGAFCNCRHFSGTLTIPNSVGSIGYSAFKDCTNLAEVVIGNGVTTIGFDAFQGCDNVTEVTIGESIHSIDERAFYCNNLQTIHFNATNCENMYTPSGNSMYSVFSTSVTTLTIGNNVTRIPNYAFKGFSNLTGPIVIPNATTYIGDYAFYEAGRDANNNMQLTLGNGITQIGDYAFCDCNKIGGSVNIPNTTTSIGERAFYGTQIQELTIGEGVATIGDRAFWNCPNLQTVHFNATNCTQMNSTEPGSSENYSVFSSNANGANSQIVSTLTIGNNVTQIPANAFRGCNLSSNPIVIPNATESIGRHAFESSQITELTIGEGVSTINDYAFYYCSNLHTVRFNATNCTSMQSEIIDWMGLPTGQYTCVFSGFPPSTIPISNLIIGENVTNIPNHAFEDCLNENCNIVIPNSVTNVGTQAFEGALCHELTIGEGVTNIGQEAFADCPNLNTVHFNATNCATMGYENYYNEYYGAFSEESPISNLTIGNNVTRIPDNAFKGCTGLSSNIVIPNACTYIGSYAFTETHIPELTIGEGVTTIGGYAFGDCPNLRTVHFNAINCTTMNSDEQYSVFYYRYGTTHLETLTIGSNVTRIPDFAFRNCYYLAGNLNLPNTITYIGDEAFSSCDGFMGTLTLPNQLTTIGESAFIGCDGFVGNLVIPETVTSIGSGAFAGCSGFTGNLVIPDGITEIEEETFEGCTGLTGVTIGNGVTEIGEEAFLYCPSLEEVTIGEAVTTIGGRAFWACPNLATVYYNATNCTQMYSREGSEYYSVFSNEEGDIEHTPITQIIIGDNVQSIPDQAFKNSPNLGELVIPASVSSIGSYAFAGCNGLAAITAVPSVPPTFGAYVFQDVNTAIPVKVPCGALNAYRSASGWSNFTNILEDYPYSVTVTSNDNIMGIASVTQVPNCTNNGQAVVTATPNLGYDFIGWTENGLQVSTDAVYIFTITANRSLVANFATSSQSYYNINVTANPTNGGVVSGGGTYEEGQMCTVTAIPNTGFTFINWTENGSFVSAEAYYSFNVSASRNLVANFSSSTLPNYVITTTANPNNGGVIVGSGTYQQGQSCTVTATAYPNYSFANWAENGIVVSSDASYTFTVSGNRNLVANFNYSALTYTISVTSNPSYGGTVTGGGSYLPGQYCSVTATPSTGYTFTNWTENGNVISFEASYTFIVSNDRNLVANFSNGHGVNEQSATAISLYPNPAKDKLTIEAAELINRIEIYTISGTLVYSQKVCAEKIEVHVNDFAFGTYIVRLTTASGVGISRFVKD